MSGSPQGLVSVVIPTFDRARLCARAVESVLAQTYPHVEVIVVDDGSRDETPQVMEAFGDRIRYVRQENAGVSAARNRGLGLATGEFVAFLDSDDTWLPWKLEAQVSVMRRYPSVGMVWTEMIAVDPGGAEIAPAYLSRMYSVYRTVSREDIFREQVPLREVWPGCPEAWAARRCYLGWIFSWMFLGNIVHTSTVLIRRDIQKAVGLFDVALAKTGEDYDFHLRTSRITEVAFLDVSSICYRVGAADQLTAEGLEIWMARNTLITVRRTFERERASIGLPEPVIRRRLARAFGWVGMQEITVDPRLARGYLRESLRWHPHDPKIAACFVLGFLPVDVIRGIKRTVRTAHRVWRRRGWRRWRGEPPATRAETVGGREA